MEVASKTVVVALLTPPAKVPQRNTNIDEALIGDVVAAPFTLVKAELRAVKSDWSGLDITQDSIPVVSQLMSEVPPRVTVLGFATRMIEGRDT